MLAAPGGFSRMASIVESHSDHNVVAVVSAIGDVTDTLLDAAGHSRRWSSPQIVHLVERLRRVHMNALEQSGLAAKGEVVEVIEDLLENLKTTLTGVSMLGELTPRSRDLIVSFGERLAAPILAAAIRSKGLESKSMTGGEAGIFTDDSYGEASPIFSRIKKDVPKTISPLLSEGTVPVVTGFIAQTEDGEITTLGRGGSDYTATILADALGADEVWIWTDVDGILTADPRVVKGARIISELSYAEAEEMAFFGAKNMHPLALGPAKQRGIHVRIKNGFKPGLAGTLIGTRQRKSFSVAKSVALVNNIGMLTISGETLAGRPGTAAKVFELLGQSGINILMISQSVSESNISIVLRRTSLERARKALSEGLSRSTIQARIDLEPDVSAIAVVGAGMKGTPGVAAKVFTAVAESGVNVRMIAQGSSELNISFVVKETDAARAVGALHSAVVLNE